MVTNYLDDFIIFEVSEGSCNEMVNYFLTMCKQLGVPVSHEKTSWAAIQVVFLGILLDQVNLVLAVPEDKGNKQSIYRCTS